MNPELAKEFERLFRLKPNELMEEIGSELSPGSILGATPTLGANQRRAESWLRKNRTKICQALSKSEKIRDLLKPGTAADRLELAAACVDAIITAFSGVPVLAISTFIVQRGVREICGKNLDFNGDNT